MTESTVAADAVLDEVMLLGIELAAVAKPRDAQAFVAMLQRFAHAIIREALEHEDEVRARLNLPRVNDTRDDHAGPTRGAQCWACHATVVGPLSEHYCERMRELRLDAPRAGFHATKPPSDATNGAIGETKPQIHATGAAGAASRADHQRDRAASDTAAAPSVSQNCDISKSVLPAAEPFTGAPSQEGAGSATGGAETSLPTCASSQVPVAPPAPSSRETEPPQQPLSGTAADGEGTPPAGPVAGAEASQPKIDHRGKSIAKDGGLDGLTTETCKQLCRDYLDARKRNGGKTPAGWAKRQAEKHRVRLGAIYTAIYPAQLSEHTDRIAVATEKKTHHVVTADPKPRRFDHTVSPDAPADTLQPREHTNSHACWCRKKPGGKANPWCQINKPEKPVGNLAGLSDPPRRAERYQRRFA